MSEIGAIFFPALMVGALTAAPGSRGWFYGAVGMVVVCVCLGVLGARTDTEMVFVVALGIGGITAGVVVLIRRLVPPIGGRVFLSILAFVVTCVATIMVLISVIGP